VTLYKITRFCQLCKDCGKKIYPLFYGEDIVTIAEDIVFDFDVEPKKKINKMKSKHRSELCDACSYGVCTSKKSKNKL
jgi:hypothetical protein